MNDIKLNDYEQLVNDYLVSLTNLYGALEPEQFVRVFNQYNDIKITKNILYRMSVLLNNLQNEYYIYENIIITNKVKKSTLDKIIIRQQGKPYYFPTLEEIEEGFNPRSYEKNRFVNELKEFLINEVYVGPLKADQVMYEIILDIKRDVDRTNRLRVLEKYRVTFSSLEQADHYIKKYNMVHGVTKTWANKGYSAMKIASQNIESRNFCFLN